MNYEQFREKPGQSAHLLNRDPVWNQFIQYESEEDEILVARFKRHEFEEAVLNSAYSKRIINFNKRDDLGEYELLINTQNCITTYYEWCEIKEPIIRISAMLLQPFEQLGGKYCIYEYSFLVRAPFAGRFETNSIYSEKEGALLYKLYSKSMAKILWPSSEIFDDLDKLESVEVNFNEYKYSPSFHDGLPYYDSEAEGMKPCLRYDWKVQNYSLVSKGQHVCSIIKNPYSFDKQEFEIYCPASGIITIGFNGKKREYRFEEEMNLHDLFSVYKNKESLMYLHFYSSEIKERDRFDGTLSLFWDIVAGRRLPNFEPYRGFEMAASQGKYIIVSLEVKKNIPYIVFSINTKKVQLSKDDSIDMLFIDNSGEYKVLHFLITKNYIEELEEKLKELYDVSYYCELSENDMICLTNNSCVGWRIKYAKQPLIYIEGSNESYWCPKEYAGEVFKSFANKFFDLIQQFQRVYPIQFISSTIKNSEANSDESCYVYLMLDTSNGYYKIGISSQPEYRERTLQSEKPTIEKICAKKFPNRAIASAIESALHKTYDSKRIRGEWFSLDKSDVEALVITLQ